MLLSRASKLRYLIGVAPVLASVLVFSRILSFGFYQDDFVHLYEINNREPWDFITLGFSGHMLFTWRAIFILTHQVFGIQPWGYHLTVLLVHALNVGLLYAVLHEITRRSIVAAFSAALWGLCPAHLVTLGWYSVFGQVLATSGMLWVILELVRIPRRSQPPSNLAVARWAGILIAISGCFAVGIPVAMSFPLVVYLLLENRSDRIRCASALSPVLILIPMIYGFFFANLGNHNPVAETGVFATMIRSTQLALGLMATGVTCLLTGPLIKTTIGPILLQPLQPLGNEFLVTVTVMCSIFAVFIITWAYYKASLKNRRAILAFIVIVLSAYGAIGLGRNESMIEYASWAIANPRYQYLGGSAIAGAIGLSLSVLLPRRRLRFGAYFLIIGFGAALVFSDLRAVQHSEGLPTNNTKYREVLRRIAVQIRRQPGPTVYIGNRNVDFALPYGFPGWAGVFILAYPNDRAEGKDIFFVEKSSTYLDDIAVSQEGTRISNVLLTSNAQLREAMRCAHRGSPTCPATQNTKKNKSHARH